MMYSNRTGAGRPWSIGLPSVLTALLPTTVCFGTFIRRGAAHQWQLRGCDGMVDAGIHRYVIASKCVEHRKRIARGQRHGDVDFVGTAQCIGDGERIVDAGIKVEDEFLAHTTPSQ